MDLLFDHLVHFINRSPAEAADKMKEIGRHAVIGGKHEKWGTWNSLMHAGLAYIEFLAVNDIKKARHADNDLISLLLQNHHHEGFGAICFRTQDISSLRNVLLQKGMNPKKVIHAERRLEDGALLQWKMLFIEQKEGELPLPFFIEWEEDSIRLKNLLDRGIIIKSGADEGISSVYFRVKNCKATAAKWSMLLDAKIEEFYLDHTLDCFCGSIIAGGTRLIFAEPSSKCKVSADIEEIGQKPFKVCIKTINGKDSVQEIMGSWYEFSKRRG
ncbi:VOC family protein [Peribacillus sp. B-H-3]|uniref:VOC family protein n=1 Tax=Peribacillus sp. B-H-3 TaxID=3400420 RepID=UPI003B010BE4